MTKEEAEKEFDLAWNELVAEGSIKNIGDDKWIVADDQSISGSETNDQ